MKPKCLRCGAKTQTGLCNECQFKLKTVLGDLPWWLDRLTETALGQSRLGTPTRRATRTSTLHGEDSPLALLPDGEQDLDEARRQRVIAVRRRALAAGGVHPSAAELLDTIANFLGTWIRDLCETHGIETPTLKIAALPPRWLAERVTLIAGHPAADEFADELYERFRAIRRIVNRPTPPRFIGPCPGALDNSHSRDCTKRHPHRCDTALSAYRNAVEVTCPVCKTIHNIERLETRLVSEIEHQRFTRAELHKVLEWLGEPVPRSTMHDWLSPRKLRKPPRIAPPLLQPAGYKRPDGRFGLSRRGDDDKPVYRLADVRKLLAETAVKRLV